MKDWIAKLFSSSDTEVSVLHVILVFSILMFTVPVLFVAGVSCGYAYAHGWILMPDFGRTVRELADAYAYVTGATGVAWALKGGGQALTNLAGKPH